MALKQLLKHSAWGTAAISLALVATPDIAYAQNRDGRGSQSQSRDNGQRDASSRPAQPKQQSRGNYQPRNASAGASRQAEQRREPVAHNDPAPMPRNAPNNAPITKARMSRTDKSQPPPPARPWGSVAQNDNNRNGGWQGNDRNGNRDRDHNDRNWQGQNKGQNKAQNKGQNNNGRYNDRNNYRNNDRNNDRSHGDRSVTYRNNDRNNYRNDHSNNRDRNWDNRRWEGRNWDRRWRDNNRYDWRGYRSYHRNVYRLGTYYSPYRNWYYSRLNIGFFLNSLFYSSRYWIDDPWRYRLPEVYGPYRWVRYYDDVLLVDIYSGEVVDVIYDFFW